LMSIFESDWQTISNISAGRSSTVFLLLQLRPSPCANASGKSSPNIASKRLIDGALKVVTTLLRRLKTPARVARLGLRRGDSGAGGCRVELAFEAFVVFDSFEDLEGRRGKMKLILFALLMDLISRCYGGR